MKKYLVAFFLLLGVALVLHHYLHESPVPNNKLPEVVNTVMKPVDTSATFNRVDSSKIEKHNQLKK